MYPFTLLIIDDEAQIRRAVRNIFRTMDAKVLEAPDGKEGLDRAAAGRPDIIILDLGLPDMSGLDVCRDLRGWSQVPILVLSARESDEEKVALLDAGADDYVTKPFSTLELQARVRVLLRRSARDADMHGKSVISCGDLVVDLVARLVSIRGRPVHLTPIEWDLFHVLITRAGRTLTHQKLFAEVWRGRSAGDAQAYLRVHIAHLRRKIEDNPVRPRHIITEPGVGYRFVLPQADG
jgi:two-component system, OmpR family, KDP operon response regulator KdpE